MSFAQPSFLLRHLKLGQSDGVLRKVGNAMGRCNLLLF